MKHILLALLMIGAALSAGVVRAQDKKKPDVFTKAEDAGPDFKIQGEYEGEIGKTKFGAQVVALGGGKFDAYFLTGGLPGAGWDVKTRVKAEAKTADDKVTFTAAKWSGSLADGKLTGKSPDGVDFTLKK